VVGRRIVLYVAAGGLVVLAVGMFVALRVGCFHGCVNPFDPEWERLRGAAAFALEGAPPLDEGQRDVVDLPDDYADLADGGDATLERVGNDLVVVFFRSAGGTGLLDSAMVYAPPGVADRGRLLDSYCIDTVYPQGASWYRVLLRDYVPALGPCR
jgi:hypothetical protein